jgi:hypothetical protein
MSMHVAGRQLEPSLAPAKAGLLRRMLAFLAKVLASPKGDQGGWEGGARTLTRCQRCGMRVLGSPAFL